MIEKCVPELLVIVNILDTRYIIQLVFFLKYFHTAVFFNYFSSNSSLVFMFLYTPVKMPFDSLIIIINSFLISEIKFTS